MVLWSMIYSGSGFSNHDGWDRTAWLMRIRWDPRPIPPQPFVSKAWHAARLVHPTPTQRPQHGAENRRTYLWQAGRWAGEMRAIGATGALRGTQGTQPRGRGTGAGATLPRRRHPPPSNPIPPDFSPCGCLPPPVMLLERPTHHPPSSAHGICLPTRRRCPVPPGRTRTHRPPPSSSSAVTAHNDWPTATTPRLPNLPAHCVAYQRPPSRSFPTAAATAVHPEPEPPPHRGRAARPPPLAPRCCSEPGTSGPTEARAGCRRRPAPCPLWRRRRPWHRGACASVRRVIRRRPRLGAVPTGVHPSSHGQRGSVSEWCWACPPQPCCALPMGAVGHHTRQAEGGSKGTHSHSQRFKTRMLHSHSARQGRRQPCVLSQRGRGCPPPPPSRRGRDSARMTTCRPTPPPSIHGDHPIRPAHTPQIKSPAAPGCLGHPERPSRHRHRHHRVTGRVPTRSDHPPRPPVAIA